MGILVNNLLLNAVLLLATTSCLRFSVQAAEDEAADDITSPSSSWLEQQHRLFADELTSKLYENPNECTSTLGISMAFGLIYPSATGSSLTEMQSVFGYPSLSETNQQLLWNSTQQELQAQHDGECFFYEYPDNVICEDMAPTIEIGNSVWVPIVTSSDANNSNNGTGLVAEYEQILGNFLHPLDFSDAGAGALVNAWVNASTNGLIDSIVDEGPLDQTFTLLAVNSIYLKAQWRSPFKSVFTNEDVFYASVERTLATDSLARFMHQVDFMEYSSTAIPGHQLLKLDFHRGNALSMVFALPGTTGSRTTSTTASSLAARSTTATTDSNTMVTSVDVWAALDSLQLQRVALALPMFKFESMYEGSLLSTLQEMGLNAPFLGELCIYDNAGNLCQEMISMVLQKTVIDVNELGVEAAAVTAIATITSAPPEETPVLVLMDHPFQFFILDTSAQVVLFEGQVGNPGISAAAAAAPAQLQAQHASGVDFWLANFNVEPVEPDFGAASSSAPNGDDNTPDDGAKEDGGGDDNGNNNSSASHAIRQYSSNSGTSWIMMVIVSLFALGIGSSGWIQA